MASKYPYPSDVVVGEHVPMKLSLANDASHDVWGSMMFDLIESQGLLGFVNGDTPAPPLESVVDYRDWKRTDALLQSWFISALPEEEHASAMKAQTSRQLFDFYIGFSSSSSSSSGSESDSVDGVHLNKYHPLLKAALNGEWEEASRFFEQEPDAVRTVITGDSETVLTIAVRSTRRIPFLKKLLDVLSPEDLLLTDVAGLSIFHAAALVGNAETVELLTKKNPQLPYLRSSNNNLAIHGAASRGHRQVTLFLFPFFNSQEVPVELNPFMDKLREKLLKALIVGGIYDIALCLVIFYPMVALSRRSPLLLLARTDHIFSSGSHFNYWQRWIYSCKPEEHSIFWETAEILVPQIKQIREKRRMHLQVQKLLKQLCTEIVKLDPKTAYSMLVKSFALAAQNGVHEVIEEILDCFPSLVYFTTVERHNMFSIAILNRYENVFNLIQQVKSAKKHLTLLKDVSRNNFLHFAGTLGTTQKLSLRAKTACAALQMQRELQWFKEVEKYTSPEDKEARNVSNKTPAMVFTETHAELVKDGEQWMKETSTSCTVAAALIVTIVFAAAITVPGGNNSETSLPLFSRDSAFNVFAIADALALFSSTSSLIMFLSILTSRYAEIDFLYSLPKRMIIGLGTLFLSIIFMMIAFAATLEILYGDERSWILVPVVAFACVPITLFMSFQFPLLIEMINSTYGPGIFRKQGDRLLF